MSKKADARRRAEEARRLAEEQAWQERRRERLLRVGISAAVLIAIAVVAIVLVNRSSGPSGTGAVPDGANAAGDGVAVGAESAPVTIDYWFDFQCPFCGQFEAENGPLLAELVADGTAQVVYHPVAFLGEESDRASNAFGCAIDAGQPVEYLTALFADQPPERSGGYTEDDLIAHGAAVGIGGQDFDACITEGTYGDWGATVRNAMNDAGFSATPTVVVNGEELDDPAGMSAGEFRAAVEEAVT